MLIVTLMLILFIAVILLSGCYTENPLCTDNYCVSGEIFLRSQLLEGEEFSEIDVAESQLLAAFANTTPQTPVQTLPDAVETDVSLMDIITDVVAGNTTYLNQTVTITAFVVWKNDSGTGVLLYENDDIAAANNEGARFFIATSDDPAPLADYSVGNSYTFTVLITTILSPNADRDVYVIGSRLTD